MMTVAAGAHAGSFLVRNADVPCEITGQQAPRPKHQFEVSIGAPTPKADQNVATLLMMTIPNADLRGPNKSFFMSIGYGDVVHGTRYITETRAGEKQVGGGTVTVTLHGQDATITFDASSADGVSYTGAIQCSGVSRY